MVQIIGALLSLLVMYLKDRDPKWRREFDDSLKYVVDGIRNRDGTIVTLEFDRLRREAQVDLKREDSGADKG